MEIDFSKIMGGVSITLIIGTLLAIFGSQLGIAIFTSFGESIEAFAFVVLFLGVTFALREEFKTKFITSVLISVIITGITFLIVNSV